MNRKAFTVIELTIAVGIIVVLIGIAIAGLHYADRQSRATSTRVAMENLKSMLAEMELATRFATPPPVWYRFTPSDGLWHTCNQAFFTGSVDFYHTADVANPALDRDSTNPARYTFSPGLVTEDARSALTELEQTSLLNTAILMSQLRTLPTNKSAVDRMPPQSLIQFNALASRGGPDVPFAGLTTPIILDAWRNPVIFVPGTSAYTGVSGTDPAKGLLIGRPYSATVLYSPGQYVVINVGSNAPLSFKCIQSVQNVTPPNATYWQPMPAIAAPNNRPFFASAGPDGDFSKGDDNIYSFEQ